jgi:translation initiation factor 1 (eIF-1/SUI1)
MLNNYTKRESMSRHGYPKQDFSTEHCTGQWTLNGSVVDHYDFESSYKSFDADKVGQNSVGYPSVKENTVYTSFEVKNRNSPAHWSGDTIYGWQGAGTWPISSISGVTNPSALVSDINGQAQDEAKQKMLNLLISNVKDQKINVGNFAAEFKQTCGTVTDAATRIASAIRAVKQGNIRQAASTLTSGIHSSSPNQNQRRRSTRRHRVASTGSVSNDWLQLQYGWLPLLSDVNGACEELARSLTYRPDERRVTATAKVHHDIPLVFPKLSPTWPTCSGKGSVDITCKGVVEFRVASRVVNLASNIGFCQLVVS